MQLAWSLSILQISSRWKIIADRFLKAVKTFLALPYTSGSEKLAPSWMTSYHESVSGNPKLRGKMFLFVIIYLYSRLNSDKVSWKIPDRPTELYFFLQQGSRIPSMKGLITSSKVLNKNGMYLSLTMKCLEVLLCNEAQLDGTGSKSLITFNAGGQPKYSILRYLVKIKDPYCPFKTKLNIYIKFHIVIKVT